VAALRGVKVLDNASDLGLHGDALLGVGLAGGFEGHDQVTDDGLGDLNRQRGGLDLLVGGGGGGRAGRGAGGRSRLVFRLGRGFVEDEEVDACGDEGENKESPKDGFGNAHQPPPCISKHKDAFGAGEW